MLDPVLDALGTGTHSALTVHNAAGTITFRLQISRWSYQIVRNTSIREMVKGYAKSIAELTQQRFSFWGPWSSFTKLLAIFKYKLFKATLFKTTV